MSYLENLEHERAKEAWSCIDYVDNEIDDKKYKDEYRSIVMKLPTMIITNGLGQSLAFLRSKGKGDEDKPHEKLYSDLASWLDKRIQWTTQGELMEKIISLPSDKFRYATSESLAYLSWMKRFADAVLKTEEN